METLTQLAPVRITADTWALPAWCPLPGMGVLPMNSFLIRGAQPTLVDAGPSPLADDLLAQLGTLVDLDDLRWIWLTHTDPDHVGAVDKLLAAAPRARVVTTFLGVGKMGLHRPLPPERPWLVNPGQRLDIGDRSLVALRPPVYDAPETIAAFDPTTRALFSADCFGALLHGPADTAGAVPAGDLRDGMLTWASIDAPWLEDLREDGYGRALEAVRRLEPTHVLGGHLPPAEGLVGRLLENLAAARGRPGFVGPDQAAVEALHHGG